MRTQLLRSLTSGEPLLICYNQSYLDVSDDTAKFHGELDIMTLGGAGFASQKTSDEWDLEEYVGIALKVKEGDKYEATSPLPLQLALLTSVAGSAIRVSVVPPARISRIGSTRRASPIPRINPIRLRSLLRSCDVPASSPLAAEASPFAAMTFAMGPGKISPAPVFIYEVLRRSHL